MPHQCTACGYTFADGSKEMLGGCPDCGGNKFQFYPEGTEVPDEPPDDDVPPDSNEPGGTASTVGRAATRVRDFVSGDPDDAAPNADIPDRSPRDDSRSEPSPAADEGATADASHPADSSDPDTTTPDPDAPWPDSSDAADPIRKGGFTDDTDDDPSVDEDGIIDADARATADAVEDAEDRAQSDARSGIASESEVDAAADPDTTPSPDERQSEPDPGREATADSSTGTAGPDADGRVVSEPSGEEADLAELREQLNDQFESIKILEPGQYELNLMELYDRDEYIIALQENGRYVIQVPEQWMSDREDR